MKFTEDQTGFFLGHFIRSYLGYSTDTTIRSRCASGGIVTSLLTELLDTGAIDGALVSRFYPENGALLGRSFIATSREEILSCGGSIYGDVIPLPLKTIREFGGRIGIVGLPCYIRGIHRVCTADKALREKIVLKIGLFCGHCSKSELLRGVLQQKGIDLENIDSIRFRQGKWRGKMELRLNNGDTVRFPFSHFSIYQNLHFFSQRKCMFCNDHTAELADISCGDAWLSHLKKEPIKHSIFISRTKRGDNTIKRLTHDNRIKAEILSPQDIFVSQKRSLIYHKGIVARARVARWFGYHIPIVGTGLDKWNNYLAAMITMVNVRWSESGKYGYMVFKIPRTALFMYLLLFKLLTNF